MPEDPTIIPKDVQAAHNLTMAVSEYGRSMDAIITGNATKSPLDGDEFLTRLSAFIAALPKKFSPNYPGELTHDLNHFANSDFFIAGYKLTPSHHVFALIAQAKKRIMMSVLQELNYTPGIVNLRESVEETVAAYNAVGPIYNPKGDFPKVASELSEDIFIRSQPDVLFRMVENLLNNSKRELYDLQKKDHTFSGKITLNAEGASDETVLSVTDNGRGFSDYFEKIGLDSDEMFVPLAVINSRRRTAIAEKKINEGEGGNGLVIVDHLGKLTGAKGFVQNPKSTQGAVIRLHFPNAA